MEYREEYIEYVRLKGYKKSTLRGKNRYLSNFEKYIKANGIKTIEEVKTETIEEFCRFAGQKKRDNKIGADTEYQQLKAVKQYFEYMHDRGRILINPCIRINMPKKVMQVPKGILDEREIERILEAPDINTSIGLRDRAILELFYSTGIRRQELVNLDIYDIDIQEGTIRINQGKGSKDRILPVGKTALHYINRYIREVRSKVMNKTTEPALFVGLRKERFTRISRRIGEYAKKICLGKNLTCHTFRHSCATHMLKAGANIRVVQELLGHASLSSTQIYTRVTPADLKEIHRKCHPRSKE